ncbi:MAG: flavodoxin-dependent (E)-4-hydroxy-3-methylbut-2-enyl-diphosphate synthase [Firmicutes bacterium]|nr:flavodoxin-dependent (E)-4-hydroxy-3-methylbut-2-enyl-diphosphate synthase [Bacillota bacterium]
MSSTASVKVRDIMIGGGAPVSIQSMTNVSSRDEEALLGQIAELTGAGCQIVRIAVPDEESAAVLAKVRRRTDVPLVADIHFDHRLAIKAVEAGADKIRINPGNIGSDEKVREVVRAAKDAGIPIRVGVNSGSLERDILERFGGVTAEGLCESAVRNLERLEDMGFDDLVVSLKSSDVAMNYEAYRLVSRRTSHPLHIGVTEAGTLKRGIIKSAVGIGALLLAGIGDTMRVSLTSDPVREVKLARDILEACGLRKCAYDLVSCPTCGRTEIDLVGLAEKVDEALSGLRLRKGIKIAVMGCVVNGPGEARGADYGVAGGKGKGVIFSRGEIVKTVKEDRIVEELINTILEGESGNQFK